MPTGPAARSAEAGGVAVAVGAPTGVTSTPTATAIVAVGATGVGVGGTTVGSGSGVAVGSGSGVSAGGGSSTSSTSSAAAVSSTSSTSGAGVYNVFWDGVDDAGERVPAGTYVLHVETSRERGRHTYRSLTLELGVARRFVQELPPTEEGGGLRVSFDHY